ncbi:Predicted acylesterase/phospholipase RssA, contains patatin domain [Massilia sp. PDC64]|nr:patatin-like phospholipase family protein [Massilia sp. PDC64]SDD49367.1 Predicted acylesterase/phospholipase RssA, contains patatin domain [Massilia sp. PDC64]
MATNHIAIACQGGGSHAAYTSGVLPILLEQFDNRADEDGPDRMALVAISGTSGGAISALLGWYGFITGGAPEAGRRLDTFWQGNSALGVVESTVNHVCRGLADLAAMGGWDIKSSPYVFPLAGMAFWNATAWPALARMLGADNPWMRPHFFSLPDLLGPSVDWPLVALLGDFASIPTEVERWLRSDLEAAMFPPTAPCQERYRADRGVVEGRIAEKLGAIDRLRARLTQVGVPPGSLLYAALERWRPPAVRFDAEALGQLADAVRYALRPIPRLLLGAVELHEGEFVAFSSERAPDDGGISIDAVLASAAVPWLFRAHEMAGLDQTTLAPRPLTLWDGLFSQNPPIRNFLSGVADDARKPDEIWVVQINPTQARAEAGGAHIAFNGGEIWDLRNALAGNLALNQELGFVDAINRRMESARGDDTSPAGAAAQRRDKLVQVDRIVMDGTAVEAAAGMPLGANSKLDRDPGLRSALWDHGATQARRYLALRQHVPALFADLDATLAGACACAAGQRPDGAGGALRPDGAARFGELVIDGATVHGIAPDVPDSPQALVAWRSAHTLVNGRPVRIEGRSELMAADAGWRLKDVRITAVVPKAQPAARTPAPARKPAGRQPVPIQPPSEVRH